MAKKPQTEEKAKGLYEKVGNYKGKTLNLSGSQLGAAGRKAAAARTVSISNTKYDASAKKVMGPAGKPLTGRVDLGGGNFGVYKNGVRIKAGKATGGNVSPGSSSGKAQGTTPAAAAKPGDNRSLSLRQGAKPTNPNARKGFGNGPMAKQTGTRSEKPSGNYPTTRKGFPATGIRGLSRGSAKAMTKYQTKEGALLAGGALLGGAAAAGLIPGAVGGAIAAGASRAGGAVARVAGAAARNAAARTAANAAVRTEAKAGLRNVGGKGAGRDLAREIAKVKSAPPKPAAAPKPNPTSFAKGLKEIKGTTKGINKQTGSVRSPNSKVAMRPANPTPAQKGSMTRYANKRAAEQAAAAKKAGAVKGKGGSKK